MSLCQLVRGDLAQVVREILEETGIDAALLELELSERGVLRSDPEILRQLNAIRALGVGLAIDDFGTGNSAVAYLKQFPIDVLKIDQSFVRGVTTSSEDAAITSATIAMARQLGLRVVAEGVEEPGQVDFLRRHGCTEYQGFLFSPAVPPGVFAEMLATRSRPGPRILNSCEKRSHEAHRPIPRPPADGWRWPSRHWPLPPRPPPSAPSASTASRWSRGCRSPR